MSEFTTEAELYTSIDTARAVYLGMVVTGHRDSVVIGEMFWAIPGRGLLDSVSCKLRDPMFQVMREPTRAELGRLKFIKESESA